MKFRTYGTRFIDKNFPYDKSKKERNFQQFSRNKPYACLWASPIYAGAYTWKDFCIDNDYCLASLREYKDVTLARDTKILIVWNDKDLKRMAREYGFFKNGQFYFNWEKIRRKYDACYIRISSITNTFKKSLLEEYNLLRWDVDSLCVFNLKKVVTRY